MHVMSENVELLKAGLSVIAGLPAGLYAQGHDKLTNGGVGRHFRHIVEFYLQFLDGLSSRVNYESRKRDANIESNPEYAGSVINNIVTRLHALEHRGGTAATIEVLTEVLDQDGSPVPAVSSIERELSVLASHTIHHYAIIALLLRDADVSLPANFGVAPSTLRYKATKTA
jgi:hypothetical protein